MRDQLKALGESLPDWDRAAGPRSGRSGQTPDSYHDIRALNPEKDAIYLNVNPPKNDGTGIYKLNVKGDVPVDGFWSISVYNDKGFFVKNDAQAYTLNNITAKKDADGSVSVQFGGCDGKAANCLPIFPGGTTWCASIARARKFSTARGKFPRRSP